MIIAFYAVAGIAALAFVSAGAMKALRPASALKGAGMGWIDDFSGTSVKLIGIAEVLGGIGLIVPMLTGIAPVLSPVAGGCLVVLMIGAVVVHVRRKEPAVPALSLGVLALASAVLGFAIL